MVLDGGDFYAETGYNSTTTQYDFGCADCHAGDSHVNGTTTVTTHGFNSGSKTCSTASCHGFMEHDGVTYNTVITPAWDGPGFTGDRCSGCHGNSPISAGHDEHQIGFHYDAVYSGFKDFLPVEDTDPKPIGLVNSAILDPYDTLRGHGGLLESDGSPNSTTMSCYVCHNDTVTQKANALATTQDGPGGGSHTGCSDCHSDTGNPDVGDAALVIADKSKHVNGVRDVVFMREKVRSKAQVRDELLDVPELSINWERQNGYKAPDGSSYDEAPTTLFDYVGGDGSYNTTTMYGYNPATMTCQISCHLWEDNRVDKYPVHWYENSRHNPDTSKHLMCIDCHTRLPM
jgi:predicted CxxxxCH...CXXCH cytochrome family protein